jgi:hypothetical protein
LIKTKPMKTDRRRLMRRRCSNIKVATIGFGTPWTFAAIHSMLMIAAQGLPGAFPHFEPSHVLMANLLGSIVTIWAVLRIRDPQLQFGRYDAIGRFLFAVWQIYAVIHGASGSLGNEMRIKVRLFAPCVVANPRDSGAIAMVRV